MDKKFNADKPGKWVNPNTDAYIDDPRREFMRAIERVAPEVVVSLREDVFLPSVQELDPPLADPTETMLHVPSFVERPVEVKPIARLFKSYMTFYRLLTWKERWHLDVWKDQLAEERFSRMVESVLEQWEHGYFQPPEERRLHRFQGARASTTMTAFRSWYPAESPEDLPWSAEELTMMAGIPPKATISWTWEYRNQIARESMENGSWEPQLELVSAEELMSTRAPRQEVQTEGGLILPHVKASAHKEMTPPPYFPVYDPTVKERHATPSWEERVDEIKRLYKERVEKALERDGFVKKHRKGDDANYEWLALSVIHRVAINEICRRYEKNRRQVRRAMNTLAERVGIERPSAPNSSS